MRIITGSQFLHTYNNSYIQHQQEEIDTQVKVIIEKVQQEGDEALRELTKTLDGATLKDLLVSEQEMEEAKKLVDKSFITAIQQAADNIVAFHQNQKETSWFTEKEGIILGQKVTPIEKVGVYIPGGKANYPSSVLMNVIPAKIAGVESISMATPPKANGSINPYVLVAASIVGVNRIYKMGGAQAIAALAYGTETVDKVYKIVGPGNAYVARAKKWVYGDVDIDMIAGPSEICIIADEDTNPSYVAADLLSQAEHDENARAICLTTSESLANQIVKEVENQLALLIRKDIARLSIHNNGQIILVDSEREAFEIANLIAPEHLQLMINNPFEKLPFVKNAGAIFLGDYSPEPLGDYFAGPNHTLPTNGTAMFSSPLGIYDFIKRSSIISYSKESLLKVTKNIDYLATVESLEAHARSINIRGEK